MVEKITLVGGSADGKKIVVNVPVPRSLSSGIWISAKEVSGLLLGTWCFISGTFDPPSRRPDG
jgi:hypothetical protein